MLTQLCTTTIVSLTHALATLVGTVNVFVLPLEPMLRNVIDMVFTSTGEHKKCAQCSATDADRTIHASAPVQNRVTTSIHGTRSSRNAQIHVLKVAHAMMNMLCLTMASIA
jgi:hypothetical protein